MSKFECDNCKNPTPCVHWVQDNDDLSKCEFYPCHRYHLTATWKEYNPKHLPKLTVEVFDRPDCPEWARWATVNEDGYTSWHKKKPERYSFYWSSAASMGRVGILCDATDWESSLIERPEKLPEWCKAGAWVWNDQFGYGKVVIPQNEFGVTAIDWTTGNRGGALPNQLKEARVRPWSDEESENNVGKPIRFKATGAVLLMLGYASGKGAMFPASGDYGNVYFASLEELAERGEMLDRSPCGVLEHLNNGEWVK